MSQAATGTGVPVDVPVIAIDGPTASGKGSVAHRVAAALGWHYLDSGALYRLVALLALRAAAGNGTGDAVFQASGRGVGQASSDGIGQATGDGAGEGPGEAALAALAAALPAQFREDRIWLAGEEVTDAIRAENVGNEASRIAVMPAVREALVERQRAFRRPPGLVADGRDMGTVIFPDAALKVFLTASPEARAARRHKQLIDKGFPARMTDLLRDLRARDLRDTTRAVAPLVPAQDALTIDSTASDIGQTVARVLDAWHRRAHR